MSQNPSVIYLVVDALRFDLVAERDLFQAVAPTLSRFLDLGGYRRVISNASNTQFVVPSILTGTYPLDHGGTNWGCRGRGTTMAEAFRDAGYQTRLLSTCILYDRVLEFDRGFDEPVIVCNRRRALMQDLEYAILPRMRAEGHGAGGDEADGVVADYRAVLRNLARIGSDRTRIPAELPRLRRYAGNLTDRVRRELAELEDNPGRTLARIAAVPEAFSYASLGSSRRIWEYAARLANKIGRRMLTALAPEGVRVKMIDAYEPTAEEIAAPVRRLLRKDGKPFFAMLHLMDAHSFWPLMDQFWRSPRAASARLKLARHYMRTLPKVPDLACGLYLAGLTAIDRLFAPLADELAADIGKGELIFAFSGDHGATMKGWDGYAVPDLKDRFRTTDLDTPFCLSGAAGSLSQDGLFDSRDIPVTLLSAAGVEVPSGMMGKSMLAGPGRDIVISENAGRGYCDLARDDLNFSVRDSRHQLYLSVRGETPSLNRMYDLQSDRLEAHDLLADGQDRTAANDLFDRWQAERGDLMAGRMAG